MTHVPEDKTKRKMKFGDLPIDVQFDKGDNRHYPAANGFPEYNVTMAAIYGEVPGTKGTDGDAVDVYIGPDLKAEKVFIIRQMKFPKYESFDEEKCMLGFHTAEEAKTCYLKHHKNKKIFGGIKELTMEDFKERLNTKGMEGKKLAAKAKAALTKLLGNENTSVNSIPAGTTLFNDATLGAEKEAQYNPRIVELMKEAFGVDFSSGKARLMYAAEIQANRSKRAELEQAEDAFAAVFDKTAAKRTSGDSDGVVRVREHMRRMKAKQANDARVARIADRVDDVGIATLATPYALKGVANTLEHRSGRLGALGRMARAGDKAIHKNHENKLELAGLAMVAPGVVHPISKGIAKGIDKMKGHKQACDLSATQVGGKNAQFGGAAHLRSHRTQKEKRAELDRFAMSINPEFEDMTEQEKLAFLGALAGVARGATALGRGAATMGGQALTSAKQGITATARGLNAVQAGAKNLAGGIGAKTGLTPAIGALKARGGAAMGGVANKARGLATGAKVLGAVGAAGAAYGGYKALQAGANFMGHEHTNPIAPPSYVGPRLF
jgi:hypothetical protein